ncbi:MAG: hypothetical protein AABY22_20615 [Nanoarchaeota archaeon]
MTDEQKTYTKEEKEKMIKKACDEYSKKLKPYIMEKNQKDRIFWNEFRKKRNKINAFPEPEIKKCEKCGQELK